MENKNILVLIEEYMARASKGQKRIGEYLLANYVNASYMTAKKLSEETGVSESTVVRYAVELGYEGYPELQVALRNAIKNKLTSLQRIDVAEKRGQGDPFSASILTDIGNLKKLLASVPQQDFEATVERIINAKHIYVIGTRSSASIAVFLEFYLSMIMDNVKLIEPAGGSEVFEQLIRVRKGDTVIGISFPRYSRMTVDALEFAKKQDADVIAVTDSEQSPIAEIADNSLYVGTDSDSFVDSLVAPLSVINALIAAISRKKKAEISETLGALEGVWADYGIYETE